MTPEHWLQVKQLFQSPIERPPAERADYLAQTCRDDPGLRSDVESLISSHDQAGDSIEAIAAEVATSVIADDQGNSIVGRQIGHYKVLSQIGRGGMGEVFLAQDSRLGRKVALKLLRSEYTNDENQLRRFRQEACTASALNHPNILTICGIGQDESMNFIATEFIDGETLRQHLTGVRMSVREAFDVTIQVASALSAAHQVGIIHRDIKPENIMIRRDGIVKVLDFGLAKLAERGKAVAVDTQVATTPLINTEPGVVMGTAQYMSPEQARGIEVDVRTDIWSLGCVLYELVTGVQPFVGATKMDVLSAILNREPDLLVHYLPVAPRDLEHIVIRALRKDKEHRYQTVKDMLIDLKDYKQALELQTACDAGHTSP